MQYTVKVIVNFRLAMMFELKGSNSYDIEIIIPKNDYKIPSTVCPILYSLVRSG